MPHLFIGIELSHQTKLVLKNLSINLADRIDGARWTPQENMHLTLKFLGETPISKLDEVEKVLYESTAHFRKFSFTLDKPGFFPGEKRAKIIWVGVRFGASELIELANAINDGLAGIGFEKDIKPFKPHITIARIKAPKQPDNAFGNIDISNILGHVVNMGAITIFESTLTSKGALYNAIARIPLRP